MFIYHDGTAEIGPHPRSALETLLSSGAISPLTLVRPVDGGDWRTLEATLSDAPTPAAIPPVPDTSLTGPVQPAAVKGWHMRPPTPWRRYAARFLDNMVNGVTGFFLIGMAFFAIAPATAYEFFLVFETPAGGFLDLVLTALIGSFVSGALVGVTGTSVGKWIFGLKVYRNDGRPLGLWPGLTRDFTVLVKGLGLGIPIVSLITMIVSYNHLRNEGVSTWDDGRYTVWHRPSGPLQYLLNVVGIIAFVAIMAYLRSM